MNLERLLFRVSSSDKLNRSADERIRTAYPRSSCEFALVRFSSFRCVRESRFLGGFLSFGSLILSSVY